MDMYEYEDNYWDDFDASMPDPEDDDCDGVCDLCSFQDECVGSDILV